MRILASGSYTIAWFKIADFVARGEKERALSVYRLLMHSVPEPALSYQLEGDILLAFDDDSAIDRYHVAANLYKKAGKVQQAISVYEHVALFKEDAKILEALIDAYANIGNMHGFLESCTRFFKLNLQKNDKNLVIQILHRHSMMFDDVCQALLYARFVRSLMLYGNNQDDLTMYIIQTLDLFLNVIISNKIHEKDLQKFLADLKALNQIEFQKAQNYLHQNS